MIDETNVVRFEPRPQRPTEPAPLMFVEVRLRDESCDLQMNLCDAAGNVYCLEYALQLPADPELKDRLRRAWAEWRGGSCAAS